MKSEEYKALLMELAHEWVKAQLPGERVAYGNCIGMIGELLTVTLDMHRTRAIFMAILNQAIHLDETSTWVEHELYFEIMATTLFGNRRDALKHDLELTPFIGDQALDLYNERLNRFR